MSVERGIKLGRYDPCQARRGGMGEVYLAQDTRLDRKVAIKFIRADPRFQELLKKVGFPA